MRQGLSCEGNLDQACLGRWPEYDPNQRHVAVYGAKLDWPWPGSWAHHDLPKGRRPLCAREKLGFAVKSYGLKRSKPAIFYGSHGSHHAGYTCGQIPLYKRENDLESRLTFRKKLYSRSNHFVWVSGSLNHFRISCGRHSGYNTRFNSVKIKGIAVVSWLHF